MCGNTFCLSCFRFLSDCFYASYFDSLHISHCLTLFSSTTNIQTGNQRGSILSSSRSSAASQKRLAQLALDLEQLASVSRDIEFPCSPTSDCSSPTPTPVRKAHRQSIVARRSLGIDRDISPTASLRNRGQMRVLSEKSRSHNFCRTDYHGIRTNKLRVLLVDDIVVTQKMIGTSFILVSIAFFFFLLVVHFPPVSISLLSRHPLSSSLWLPWVILLFFCCL